MLNHKNPLLNSKLVVFAKKDDDSTKTENQNSPPEVVDSALSKVNSLEELKKSGP